MSKTCRSCGKEYKGEFCEHCGYGDPNLKIRAAEKYKTQTPVRFMTPEQKKEYYDSLKKKEEQRRKNGGKKQHDPKQLRLLAIVAAAVALLIFGTLFRSGALGIGETNSDVVEKYFAAVNERSFDKYIACFPPEMKKDYEQDLADTGFSKSEYMDAFCADFAAEYGSDFLLEYEILSTAPLNDYSMDEYKAAYGSVPSISEAYIVTAEVTYKGSKGSDSFRYNCYVGRVGRHYRLFNIEFDPGIVTADMLEN